MTNFEYACPKTEQEAVAYMAEHDGNTAVLAGGTDLVRLLENSLLKPSRVVDITGVESLRGVHPTADGVAIGALTTLEEIVDSPYLADYPSLGDVVKGIRAIQVQQNGTIAGDLCHMPNCWYYRKGYGLLALDNGVSLPHEGDNRYHAIFGNLGLAKFVSASRFAPALIAFNAQVRIIGPHTQDETLLPLRDFYVTPRTERHGISVLKPGQLVSHVLVPHAERRVSATYEVLETEGLDWPLAACAATLDIQQGIVRSASIVLGHVAPTPWVSAAASSELIGKPVTIETAHAAGVAAVRDATPLSHNEYKVQLAQTAVKRAILRASGQL